MVEPVERQVLVVGEYYKGGASGGIASVLRCYAAHFPSWHFVASSRRMNYIDKIVYDLGGLFKMAFILACDRKIRIVHIHTAADGSFRKHCHYIRIAKIMGRKVILHSHASRFIDFFNEAHDKRRIVRILCGLDALAVLSDSWRRFFIQIGVNSDKVVVVNNIVEATKGVSNNTEDDLLHLLFLGEIGHRKGIFDILDVLRRNRVCFAGRIFLEIGGNKNERKLLEALEGLEDMAHFCGFVSGDHKEELLTKADALILPSYNEGLPISILEAMAHGCAIIASDVGGIPEIVDQTNGILVRPGDFDGLASAISSFLDKEYVRSMGKESMRKVEAFYPQSVIASLERLYTELIQ